jgi:hypothetical protein
LAVWSAGWVLFIGLQTLRVAPWVAVVGTVGLVGCFSALAQTTWRRALIALGFPLSLAVCGAAGALPGWAWLLPMALMALVYPPMTWRDAPFFPTPAGALRGLAQRVPLELHAQVLDAGCGLGDGLRELHREYPQARLQGLEWSRPLCLLCAWRCRYAQVQRGDLWAYDWGCFELVYVFQRPESMARVAAKARREMRSGAWLASLEFEVPQWTATEVLTCADGRPLWLYRTDHTRTVAPAQAAAPRQRRAGGRSTAGPTEQGAARSASIGVR